ncbi:uncharacterized protein M437DRAFT_62035 [Aureobasidium melanogenum CBS 110374]|uniref:Uncharacterized protein n=1 Tax=Aureobasidium melanogenum (strain CBS 110374) TaxID=1043003 RepID=A0A074W3G9_AURM1|nr:uncharacterized protein M437DRAFT_62035 [Aureobasidium melanogenum CBS 110374]KEQ67650.1 hypothetical protein M437DRAFT_62035 [Aureobasidium melanogenum CBS 110374]
MAYGRQICYEAQSSLRSTNDLGVEDGRQGRTSITHTLTKAADVLLEAWRFRYACEHDLEVDSLVVNWCRIKRFLGIRCLDAGARKRFGPSVFAVVGEIHARQSQHRGPTAMPVSSDGDSLSVASQVMRAQAHVRPVEKQRARGRITCRFSISANCQCGRPANSTSSLLYEEKDVYALPFAQHSTAIDCCFLDDAPCRWSHQEAKTLDHTSVGCQSLARSRALSPASHRATTATAFRARA